MPTSANARIAPPAFLHDEQAHRRAIAAWEREAHQGHLGNVGTVTLTTSTAATSVVDNRVGAASFIGFMPTTANAAEEIGSGTFYVSSRSSGGFTIAHASTTTADRAYVYCILG